MEADKKIDMLAVGGGYRVEDKILKTLRVETFRLAFFRQICKTEFASCFGYVQKMLSVSKQVRILAIGENAR